MTDTRRADTAEAAEVVKAPEAATISGIAAEMREHMKLKYAGDCKCGHCQLVPDELVNRAAYWLEIMAWCGFDWSGGETVTAEDARETIHETLDDRLNQAVRALARAEKAEAALASQAIPEGFVLAPKEPTETMMQAGEDAFVLRFAHIPPNPWSVVSEIYRAMLAAIPAAPEVNK